jgi:hypothetical protein
MTPRPVIVAFNALQARLDRSPTDRMILQYPEWLALRQALSDEVVNEAKQEARPKP